MAEGVGVDKPVPSLPRQVVSRAKVVNGKSARASRWLALMEVPLTEGLVSHSSA